MKIVHIVYSLEMGGAEMLVAQLCRVQRARGHAVSVCAFSTLGLLGAALRSEGIHIDVLGEASPARTMARYFKIFRRIQPDVVHCHNPAPTLQAAAAARFAGTSCVLSTRHSLVAPPYELAAEIKFGLCSYFCDWVVGICEATCENLRRAPLARRDRVVRIFNGTSEIVPVAPSAHPRKIGFTLVFVGRLATIKDLATLIRAAGQAVKSLPDLQLWLVGDGPTRRELEELSSQLGLSDHVTFWGQQRDIDRFLSAADLFVMTSISEGLPMSLLQAMSAGLPALVTDVGGMAETVRRSHCGLIAPVGDIQAISTAMIQLAGDTEGRATFALHALAAYRANFTLEHMADAYMQLYQTGRPKRLGFSIGLRSRLAVAANQNRGS